MTTIISIYSCTIHIRSITNLIADNTRKQSVTLLSYTRCITISGDAPWLTNNNVAYSPSIYCIFENVLWYLQIYIYSHMINLHWSIIFQLLVHLSGFAASSGTFQYNNRVFFDSFHNLALPLIYR